MLLEKCFKLTYVHTYCYMQFLIFPWNQVQVADGFEKNFVKVKFLLKKLLNSWFHGNDLGERKFLVLPHCMRIFTKNS